MLDMPDMVIIINGVVFLDKVQMFKNQKWIKYLSNLKLYQPNYKGSNKVNNIQGCGFYCTEVDPGDGSRKLSLLYSLVHVNINISLRVDNAILQWRKPTFLFTFLGSDFLVHPLLCIISMTKYFHHHDYIAKNMPQPTSLYTHFYIDFVSYWN